MKFDGESIYELRLKPACTRSRRAVRLACDVPRCQQVAQANPTKKLSLDTIRNCIDHLRAVLRRIQVHAERPLSKGSIHDLNDGFRDSGHIGVRRHNRREAFHDVVGKALSRNLLISPFKSRNRPGQVPGTLQELVDKSFQIKKSSWTSSWHSLQELVEKSFKIKKSSWKRYWHSPGAGGKVVSNREIVMNKIWTVSR